VVATDFENLVSFVFTVKTAWIPGASPRMTILSGNPVSLMTLSIFSRMNQNLHKGPFVFLLTEHYSSSSSPAMACNGGAGKDFSAHCSHMRETGNDL
jgi:hypothetical protein